MDISLLQTVSFVPGESIYIFGTFSLNSTHLIQTPINVDNGSDSHRTLTLQTLHYQLCAIIVIDLSFLKVKKPSFDSMSMFPALQYTG